MVLSAVYVICFVVWNLLRLTPAARAGPFQTLDLFGWLLYAPLPVLAVVAAIRRRWRSLALLVLPAMLCAVEYGPQFAPHRVPPGDPVRIVSANVYVSNPRPQDLGRVLARFDADVIALQEFDREARRSISAEIGRRYRYRALHTREDPYGFGVYSRYPLRGLQPRLGPDECSCQVVEIDVPDGAKMTLINTHIPPPGVALPRITTSHQAPAVETLLDIVRLRPSVVVGDLNISDRHYLFRRLRTELGDSYRDAGWGFGFTWRAIRRPFVRIDHVLHDDSWATKSIHTAKIAGSDHRGLEVELVKVGTARSRG